MSGVATATWEHQPIGWLRFAVLRRLRALETTAVFGAYSRLSLDALGREWGECEWTARDLW